MNDRIALTPSPPIQPPVPGQIHFLLGGVRCGKSTRAEALASAASAPVVYVATLATTGTLDAEMRARLALHRSRRPADWTVIENHFDLEALFSEHAGKVVLVDCLTMWLSWWSGCGERLDEEQVLHKLERSLSAVPETGVSLILVGNELGMGLVPLGAENRAYRDLCGRANQLVARHAAVVEFMIAGLPLRLK